MKSRDTAVDQNLIYALLAMVVPLILYARTLGFEFVYDDSELIVGRLPPELASDWLKIATSPYYQGLPYYRPLPGLLFALERALLGLTPLGYHLVSLLIVAALGLALFHLLSQPLFSLSPNHACALSVICTSHPAISSVVYMISGYEALLSALFLTLCSAQLAKGRFGPIAAISLLLALFARESGVFIIPFAAIALLLRLNRQNRAIVLLDILRLSVVVMVYLSLRQVSLEGGAATVRLSNEWGLVPLSYVYALSSLLTPSIQLHYEPELSEWLTEPRMALLAFTLVIVIIFLRQSRALKNRTVCTCALLSFLSLLPTANIFEQETPFDERHLITPLIALTVTLGIPLIQLLTKSPVYARSVRYWCLPLLLILMPISFSRAKVFENDDAFFTHWNELSPNRSKIINHLAARQMAEGNLLDAYKLVEHSVTLRGNSPGFLYRGRIERLRGNLAKSRADLTSAIELDPNLAAAYCDLALVEILEGNGDAARSQATEAGRRDTTIWCNPYNSRHWEDLISGEGQQLQRYPISTREELRNYRQDSALLRARIN